MHEFTLASWMGRIIAADILESRRDDWTISDDGVLGATNPARRWRGPPTLPADDSTPAISVKARLTRSGLPDAYDFLRPKLGRPVLEPWEMEGREAPSVPMSTAGSFDNELLGTDRYGGGDAAMLVRFLSRSDAGALDGWGGFSGHTCQGLYDSLDDAGMPQSWYDVIGRAQAQIVALFQKWSSGKFMRGDAELLQQKFSNLMAHATDGEKWPRFNDAKATSFKLLDSIDQPMTGAPSPAAIATLMGRSARNQAPGPSVPTVVTRGPVSPNAGAHKAELSAIWKGLEDHINTQGGVLSDIGGALGSVGSAIGAVAKGIATPVAALVTSPARLVADLATGKNVFQSLKDTVKRDLASAKQIAPYVQAALSVIPGVGTGINMAISAGAALAQGQPLTAALVAGIKGALPGGPLAAQAFDMAYSVARGENVGEAALQALVNNAPGGAIGKQAAQAAIAVAKGQNLQQAAIALAKGIASEKLGTLLPGVPSSVSSAARDLVSGKNVIGMATDRFGALVPGGVPSIVSSAARDLVSGKNVSDVVTQAAKGQAMVMYNRFSPNAVGVLNQTGPRVANTVSAVLPSILPSDVRMVAQSILTNPNLRTLSVDELARKLGTSTHVVRDGMGAVLQAVQKSGGSVVPSLSYSKAMAARVPTTMSFDGAMANVVSRAAPKVYSHNASGMMNGRAARLRSAGMIYRSLSAQGIDAGALDPKSMPTIRRGSSGDAVVQWQKVLGVAADGKFGPNTESATIILQNKNRLTPDGIVGPQTWAAGLITAATKALPPLPPATSPPIPLPGSPMPDVTSTATPAAAPVLAQTMPMIRRGSEGPPVRAWQTFLALPVDGKFGPQTEAATRTYQARVGLVADGIVGPATWSKAMSGLVPISTTTPPPVMPPAPIGTPTMPPFFPPGPPGPPDPIFQPPPPLPPGWGSDPFPPPPDPKGTPPFFPPAPPWGVPQNPPTREPGPIVVAPPPGKLGLPKIELGIPKIGGANMPTIRKGSTGDTVRTWQTFLKLGNIDGIFGPETEAATIAFQTRSGLTPDGIVGPLTWAAAARVATPPPSSSSDAMLPLVLLGGGALALLLLSGGGKTRHRHAHARR